MNLASDMLREMIRETEDMLRLRDEYARLHPVRRLFGRLGFVDFEGEANTAAYFEAKRLALLRRTRPTP
jgi:hypothetical protein